ncbi:MAG: SPOR domain-containing protein [Thauera sp.]
MKRVFARPAADAPALRRPRRDALLRAGIALTVAAALGVLGLLAGERNAGPDEAAPTGAGGMGASVSEPVVGQLASAPAPAAPAPAPTEDTPAAQPASAAAAASTAAVVQGVLLPHEALRVGGAGYRIQLGVFGDAANALQLYEQLSADGYAAHIQSRVVVGPFADRASAEKARAALQRSGMPAGILVPPPQGAASDP